MSELRERAGPARLKKLSADANGRRRSRLRKHQPTHDMNATSESIAFNPLNPPPSPVPM
jgi:hypothetical protein